jgi:L-2-hydroxycarboxylate dehydrogenase (NAD+)
VNVSLDSVRRAALDFLTAKYDSHIADRTVEVLLWGDCAGVPSQGLLKLTGTSPLQHVPLLHPLAVERDAPSSQLINGGGNPAPYIAQVATDAVITKATAQGIACVGVHNCFSSNGAQAFYLNRITEQGFVGIMCSSSPSSVAPFGSMEALFGTNPIAFGFPSLGDPVLFDMATSAMTWYGLVLAAERGESIPEDVALDAEGAITTDPNKAMDGGLVSFADSNKGSGLGLAVQLLAGPLVNAPFGREWNSQWGALLIAIDPAIFTNRETFRSSCSAVIDAIKTSRARPGRGAIRVPGERLFSTLRESLSRGSVDIDKSALETIGF